MKIKNGEHMYIAHTFIIKIYNQKENTKDRHNL